MLQRADAGWNQAEKKLTPDITGQPTVGHRELNGQI